MTSKKKRGRGRFPNVKSGWYLVGDFWYFFRSRQEHRFALILEYYRSIGALVDWYHEPCYFEFPQISHGTTRYKPDFVAVFQGYEFAFEVKGKLNKGDWKKFKLFEQSYPHILIWLINTTWMRTNGSRFSLHPRWNAEPIAKKENLPSDARKRSVKFEDRQPALDMQYSKR